MDWRRELMGGLSSEMNIDNYLTIEALEDGLTASLSTNACQYCVDGDGVWKTLAAGTATEAINAGQTLSFRGELTPNSYAGIGTFTISKRCNLLGNCMSMLFKDSAANNYSLSDKSYAFYKLFYNCTNIVNVSSNFLPATTLATYCYHYMLYGCTNLTTAPKLPATRLTTACYSYMFRDCTSLTTAPALPATTLADYCYQYMFCGCTGLATAPKLPAQSLLAYCYQYMFYGCTSLTTAPELPATTLATYCYSYMFGECTSLTTAPELPATTLKTNCYSGMFHSCTSLTTAPELPATTLVYYCYSYMFFGCSKLKYIKALFTTTPSSSYTSNWVNRVASSGTFVKNPNATWDVTVAHGIPSGWTVVNDGEPVIDINNYLTIEALEDGLTASLSVNACEYCVDGDGNWKSLSAGTATESINSGHTLSFRGNLTPTSSNGIGTFNISKKCNLKGNVMSMLFGDAGKDNYNLSGKDYAFCGLFNNCFKVISISKNFLPALVLSRNCYVNMFQYCSELTTAPDLPATTLANDCYSFMFRGCYKLTSAPDLPATTLTNSCYTSMFRDCISLTTAPDLPATTLADLCYFQMFRGCSKLNYIKMLATDISKQSCLLNWVQDVASSGTFVKNKNATWNVTGASGVPSGWTVQTV